MYALPTRVNNRIRRRRKGLEQIVDGGRIASHLPAAEQACLQRSAAKRPRRGRRRRGVATLWLILTLPVLLLLVCFLIEIGNIWLARVQLENALEAAALAAVKEWADAGGGDTQLPRYVGQEYAAANPVTGTAVAIDDNYGAGTNQNASCGGDLVFGAITTDDIPWVFNAGIQPACGLGEVLLDATSNSSMQDRGSWGINFQLPDANTPAGLTISRVQIDLNVVDANAVFDLLGADPPIISDRLAGAGKYVAPNEQDDTSGLDDGPLTYTNTAPIHTWVNNQVRFIYDENIPGRLVIEFFDSNGDPNDGESGFEPGDRIRFGARVDNLSTGSGNNDGDGVGRERVRVTVTFAIFGTDQSPPSVGAFQDSEFGDCSTPNRDLPPPDIDPCIAGNAPYVLPPGDSNAKNNDHQAYVIVGGAGGNALAVRAQATAPVNSICCRLCGVTLPLFEVSACATARDDCTEVGPHLIRIRPENFICPGP